MVARAFGSATISFGLVSIPVKIYTTRRPQAALSFHLLHDTCGTRLSRQYICPTHGEVVSQEHISRGYELEQGRHVMLSGDELEAAQAVSDYAIALSEFVPADTVDAIYLETPYYLAPAKGGERSYQLFNHAMQRTGRVGVARYATRGKQHVVLLRPYGEGGMVMHPLRYCDEIRSFADIPLRTSGAPDEEELAFAIELIERVATDAFRPERYSDEVKERVLALVQEKVDGQNDGQNDNQDHDLVSFPGMSHEGERGMDLAGALEASLGLTGVHDATS